MAAAGRCGTARVSTQPRCGMRAPAAARPQHRPRPFTGANSPSVREVASAAARGGANASVRCRSTHAAASAAAASHTAALIFDCDGVIVETEELHRRAYNAAFEAFGLAIDGTPLQWSVEYYDVLQNTVGGGKPKMRYHFSNNGWPAVGGAPPPEGEGERTRLIDDLQDKKTEVYKRIVEEAAEARPGVLALMDEALARPDIAVCICSAATKAGFEKVVNSVVGRERLAHFDVILAGDDVDKKKPDPLIYNLARERLGLPAERCLVIEDSMVGLRAALGAGMRCIITPTASTMDAPFCEEGAAAVVGALGGEFYRIGVDDLFKRGVDGVTRPNLQLELEGDMCVLWPTTGIVAYSA